MSASIKLFNECLETNDWDKINEHFIHCCSTSATLEEIRYMVDNGANPRANGDFPFYRSSWKDTNILLYFINECGVDINTRNGIALEKAIYNNNVELIKLLIDMGANPRINDDKLFRVSCKHNYIGIISFFLNEVGADINAKNGIALVNAIQANYAIHDELINEDVIELLLKSGIIISDDAIKVAFIKARINILKLFAKYGISYEYMFQIFFQELIKNKEKYAIMKFLSDNIDDIGQSFNQSLARFR